jgi:hypothetical protein
MLGTKDLPDEFKDSFSKVFCPSYIAHVGLSSTPWESPGVQVQQAIFDEVYPDYEATLNGKDAASDVVSIFLFARFDRFC